jgi:anti-anti-sigma factor
VANRFRTASVSVHPPGSFNLDRSPGIVRIRVQDDFDVRCVRRIASALSSTLHGGEIVDEVVLDLTACHFIDSSGLRMILELESQSRRLGHSFAVQPSPGQVERVLELSGVDGAVTLLDARR